VFLAQRPASSSATYCQRTPIDLLPGVASIAFGHCHVFFQLTRMFAACISLDHLSGLSDRFLRWRSRISFRLGGYFICSSRPLSDLW
jgi:hypothetical protein